MKYQLSIGVTVIVASIVRMAWVVIPDKRTSVVTMRMLAVNPE